MVGAFAYEAVEGDVANCEGEVLAGWVGLCWVWKDGRGQEDLGWRVAVVVVRVRCRMVRSEEGRQVDGVVFVVFRSSLLLWPLFFHFNFSAAFSLPFFLLQS